MAVSQKSKVKEYDDPSLLLGANPCESNPCKNGGKCFPSQDGLSFTCQCPEECTGDLCQNCDSK